MNKIQIPKNSFGALIQKLQEENTREVKRMYNFKNCNQNLFMRKSFENNICPVCAEELKTNESVIHHTTYNHKCYYAYDSPPCEICKKEHPEMFKECKSKLLRIHNYCHEKIHGKENKENE